jgi:hypothetical protein
MAGSLMEESFQTLRILRDLQMVASKFPHREKFRTVINFVFVGDEAFGMRPDFLIPCPKDKLNKDTRNFNYRLIVENTFGIMASPFQVLQTAINLDVQNIYTMVITCCVLIF